MAVHCRLALLCGLGALLIGQASHAAPPFEKLSLRDALLARPEIIASLDQEARQQLVQRFEAARRNPTEPLRTTTAGATIAVEQMRAMDEARYAARADAFIAGKLVTTPTGLEAVPFSAEVSDPGEPMPIEWIATGPTAEAEQSALLGNAGAIIRRLMLVSESSRLVRVESWPIAVLAIDGTLYVNAAWLVAMSPYVEPRSPDATRPQAKEPKPSLEPGCGGGAVITPSSQATSNDPRVTASEPQQKDKTEEPRPTEKTTQQTNDRGPETQRTADSGGQLPEVQKIFGDDVKSDTAPPKESRTASDDRVPGTVRAESLPPDQSYSYAGAGGLINPADCCRDQNACGGADSSCAANATVCADPNSTCSTANCSTNTCSTGSCDTSSCNTSSCNTGSGCSSDDSCNKCNSGSGDSGCSSGSSSSGSSCSSGSGSSSSSCSGSSGGSSSSSCSGSSGGSSSSSCGSSSSGSSSSCKSSSCGSSGKCAVAAPPPMIRRRAGDIPDVATLGILLLPLWYLVRQGRRRAQA